MSIRLIMLSGGNMCFTYSGVGGIVSNFRDTLVEKATVSRRHCRTEIGLVWQCFKIEGEMMLVDVVSKWSTYGLAEAGKRPSPQ